MIKCMFTGQVNSGKTALIMALARYNSTAKILVEQSGAIQSLNVTSLLREKVSASAYHTESLDEYQFIIGCSGLYYKFNMIDTIGLIDDVYMRQEFREAVWEVFYNLSQCDILVHTVNALELASITNSKLIDVEKEIISYIVGRECPCIICATFSDKREARKGLKVIRKTFPNIPVIPVSSTTNYGIRKLNDFLTNSADAIVGDS